MLFKSMKSIIKNKLKSLQKVYLHAGWENFFSEIACAYLRLQRLKFFEMIETISSYLKTNKSHVSKPYVSIELPLICIDLPDFVYFCRVFYFSEIPLVGLIPDCQNFRLSKNFEYKQKSCESINKREARS